MSTISCTLIICLITIVHSNVLLSPTISNSSGDYYISKNESDLNDGQINCKSDKLCHMQCSNYYSCNNIQIHCNNVDSCILDCVGSNTCQPLTLYVGSKNNTINCVGYASCTNEFSSSLYPNTKIYTNYKNNPSSNTELTCTDVVSCRRMQILDVSGATGYSDASKFKILCVFGCDIDIYQPYPQTAPTVVNATGEYYFNSGSFVDVSCSHALLCSVDCSGGSCKNSKIDCGNANKCEVLCYDSGDKACTNMEIIASNNKQFHFTCVDVFGCENSQINIQNVTAVSINCGDACDSIEINLQSIHNVEFQCNGGWWCRYMKWDINMVDNFTGSCSGCLSNQFRINNTKYFDFNCFGHDSRYEDSCEKLDIISYTNNDILNLKCNGDKSCTNTDICIEDDNEFKLYCCGYQSCNSLSFCDQTNHSFTSIDCDCGQDSCINMKMPLTRYPTISPSHHPTINPSHHTINPSPHPSHQTINPSQHPTVYPSDNPIVSPTTGPTGGPKVNPIVNSTIASTMQHTRSNDTIVQGVNKITMPFVVVLSVVIVLFGITIVVVYARCKKRLQRVEENTLSNMYVELNPQNA